MVSSDCSLASDLVKASFMPVNSQGSVSTLRNTYHIMKGDSESMINVENVSIQVRWKSSEPFHKRFEKLWARDLMNEILSASNTHIIPHKINMIYSALHE